MPTLTAKKSPRSSNRVSGRPAPELIFGDLWNYDPAPETADPKLKARYELFIGGKFTAPLTGKYFDSINPANEKKLTEIAQAGEADVAAAYQAAQKAYDSIWGKMAGSERAKYIFRIARLLQDRAASLRSRKRLTGANQSKNRGILMCRWPQPISFITQVGPINSIMSLPALGWRHLALWGKSSRGIFPC